MTRPKNFEALSREAATEQMGELYSEIARTGQPAIVQIKRAPKAPPMPGAELPEKFKRVVKRVQEALLPKVNLPVAIGEQVFKKFPDAKATPAEDAAARTLQERYNEAWTVANVQFIRARAHEEYNRSTEAAKRDALEGTLNNSPCEPFASIADRYEARQIAAKTAVRAIEVESGKLCAPIREKFLVALKAYLAEIEAKERADAEQQLGLPYQPSSRVQAARSFVVRLELQSAIGAAGPPSFLLPWLNLKTPYPQ